MHTLFSFCYVVINRKLNRLFEHPVFNKESLISMPYLVPHYRKVLFMVF